MWCLLSPPRSRFDPRRSWPSVGGWTPAAPVDFGIQRTHSEPRTFVGRAQRRGNRITMHADYRLTRSEDYLRAPFIAIEEARRGRLCALSLLSAARSLYLAQRIPNELERTERILYVWPATRCRTAASEAARAMGAGRCCSSTCACAATY
jgi:hypothetical protein